MYLSNRVLSLPAFSTWIILDNRILQKLFGLYPIIDGELSLAYNPARAEFVRINDVWGSAGTGRQA